MKKIISFLILMCLSLSFAGCKDGDDPNPSKNSDLILFQDKYAANLKLQDEESYYRNVTRPYVSRDNYNRSWEKDVLFLEYDISFKEDDEEIRKLKGSIDFSSGEYTQSERTWYSDDISTVEGGFHEEYYRTIGSGIHVNLYTKEYLNNLKTKILDNIISCNDRIFDSNIRSLSNVFMEDMEYYGKFDASMVEYYGSNGSPSYYPGGTYHFILKNSVNNIGYRQTNYEYLEIYVVNGVLLTLKAKFETEFYSSSRTLFEYNIENKIYLKK